MFSLQRPRSGGWMMGFTENDLGSKDLLALRITSQARESIILANATSLSVRPPASRVESTTSTLL